MYKNYSASEDSTGLLLGLSPGHEAYSTHNLGPVQGLVVVLKHLRVAWRTDMTAWLVPALYYDH